MATGTVRLHRVLRATPERIYRAFLEPDAMAKWIPPYGFTCQVQHMDVRVGGRFRMSFRNFGNGNSHSFGGEYLELVPEVIPVEMCYLGWQESLEQLAKLVEPQIPD